MGSRFQRFGIAQAVLYGLIIVFPGFLLLRNRGKLRAAWILLSSFCSIRLSMSILEILYDNSDSKTGLLVGISVLSALGLGPLLIAITFILWHMMSELVSYHSPWSRLFLAARLLLVVEVVLLCAGGIVKGSSTAHAKVGEDLIKAGYVVLACSLSTLVFLGYIVWREGPARMVGGRKYMVAVTIATPLLTIRLVYGFLAVFNPTSSTWAGVEGSLAAYTLMSLLPEYISAVLLIGAGRLALRDVRAEKRSGRSVRLHERAPAGP